MKLIYVALLSLLFPFAASAVSISGATSVCVGSIDSLYGTPSGGTWSTSSGSIATVLTSGIILGVSSGTATITYTYGSGYSTTTVTVSAAPSVASIAGVSSICAGVYTTLTDASAGGTWSSANPTIATVGASTGVVTGVSAGTASISYSISNMCGTTSQTFSMTVNPAPTHPAAITGPTSVTAGHSVTLADATSGGVWSTSASTIASISSTSGVATGIALGTAIITYTITNSCGSAYDTARLTVTSALGFANATHNASAISVYPNPTSGSLNITSTEPINGIATIVISDVTGKAILTKSVATLPENIDLSSLENGIYFVVIRSNDLNYNNKIVVAH